MLFYLYLITCTCQCLVFMGISMYVCDGMTHEKNRETTWCISASIGIITISDEAHEVS